MGHVGKSVVKRMWLIVVSGIVVVSLISGVVVWWFFFYAPTAMFRAHQVTFEQARLDDVIAAFPANYARKRGFGPPPQDGYVILIDKQGDYKMIPVDNSVEQSYVWNSEGLHFSNAKHRYTIANPLHGVNMRYDRKTPLAQANAVGAVGLSDGSVVSIDDELVPSKHPGGQYQSQNRTELSKGDTSLSIVRKAEFFESPVMNVTLCGSDVYGMVHSSVKDKVLTLYRFVHDSKLETQQVSQFVSDKSYDFAGVSGVSLLCHDEMIYFPVTQLSSQPPEGTAFVFLARWDTRGSDLSPMPISVDGKQLQSAQSQGLRYNVVKKDGWFDNDLDIVEFGSGRVYRVNTATGQAHVINGGLLNVGKDSVRVYAYETKDRIYRFEFSPGSNGKSGLSVLDRVSGRLLKRVMFNLGLDRALNKYLPDVPVINPHIDSMIGS